MMLSNSAEKIRAGKFFRARSTSFLSMYGDSLAVIERTRKSGSGSELFSCSAYIRTAQETFGERSTLKATHTWPPVDVVIDCATVSAESWQRDASSITQRFAWSPIADSTETWESPE